MPDFLETQLRQSARKKGLKGKAADRYVYGGMNNAGAMRGSKITAKGREMERKHEAKMKTSGSDVAESKPAKPGAQHMRELRIEIHRGPKPKHAVTGYTVHHHMVPKPGGKTGAFYETETHTHPFSAKEHGKMVSHVSDALLGADEG